VCQKTATGDAALMYKAASVEAQTLESTYNFRTQGKARTEGRRRPDKKADRRCSLNFLSLEIPGQSQGSSQLLYGSRKLQRAYLAKSRQRRLTMTGPLLLCNRKSYLLLTGYSYEKHPHHDDLAPARDG